jgi:hypothetical protein
MENPGDYRMIDAPDNLGEWTDGLVAESQDGDGEDDGHGDRDEERDEDEETGMDEGCLDTDTSGDECERMSLSGNHPTMAPGYITEDVSALAGSSQGGSMSTNGIFGTESAGQVKSQKKDKRNSIFDTERPPPIPAEKNNLSNNKTAANTPPPCDKDGVQASIRHN